MINTDTIAAPITPLVTSPVITLRISGSNALKVYSLMEKGGKSINISDIKPNYMSLYRFNVGKENLHDDVLAVYFRAPHSFTGEDVVEISFHGNPVLVNAALSAIYSLNIRSAEGGEFSKRAFLNGKIDLTQAESIQELISAKSVEGVNSAYNQLQGSLRHELDGIKDILLKMKAVMEAKIDFPDEDTVDEELPVLKRDCESILLVIDRLISSYKSYRNANRGLEIVIAGKPNVGKSSLMNAFLKEERTIVSDTPGTTRDFIKESLYIGGIPVHLTDTAGIRLSDENIEQIGIERSRQKIETADIVLLLFDVSNPLTEEDYNILEDTKNSNRIIIGNKLDIADDKSYDKADIYVSAKTGLNVEKLAELLREKISLYDNEIKSNAAAITERHHTILIEIKKNIEKINLSLGIYPIDMLCIDLERAVSLLSEITGDTYTEKILDIVFSSFCIGK
ncbi:MAG: tRNA uridine-5-carboxymethylaminomethyl(34) synthesis GTPase MnmE [Mucispirillum sp.]|nr:tRNA uridine-5-carboxymethylaminomethyl(34) synthesis GTPase MnmE [Mucispirillum sp.]